MPEIIIDSKSHKVDYIVKIGPIAGPETADASKELLSEGARYVKGPFVCVWEGLGIIIDEVPYFTDNSGVVIFHGEVAEKIESEIAARLQDQ